MNYELYEKQVVIKYKGRVGDELTRGRVVHGDELTKKVTSWPEDELTRGRVDSESVETRAWQR
jgi:hypothetical protein